MLQLNQISAHISLANIECILKDNYQPFCCRIPTSSLLQPSLYLRKEPFHRQVDLPLFLF